MGRIRRGVQYDENGVAQESARARILELVRAAGAGGLNEAGVMEATGMSRGSASAALNVLYADERIAKPLVARGAGERRQQGVFVVPEHLNGRETEAYNPLERRLDDYLNRLVTRLDHAIENGTKWGIGETENLVSIIEKNKPVISRPTMKPGSNPHSVISLMRGEHPNNVSPARGWSRHDVVQALSLSESTASSVLSQLHEAGVLERLRPNKAADERFGRYLLTEQVKGRPTAPHQRQSSNSELAGIALCDLLIAEVGNLKHGNNVLTRKLMETAPALIERVKA